MRQRYDEIFPFARCVKIVRTGNPRAALLHSGETNVFLNQETDTPTAFIRMTFDKSGTSRHIANICKEGELDKDTTVAKIATVANSGIRGGRGNGNAKGEYGVRLLTKLSHISRAKLGKGYSRPNLNNRRRFYLLYPIRQTVSDKLWFGSKKTVESHNPIGVRIVGADPRVRPESAFPS